MADETDFSPTNIPASRFGRERQNPELGRTPDPLTPIEDSPLPFSPFSRPEAGGGLGYTGSQDPKR